MKYLYEYYIVRERGPYTKYLARFVVNNPDGLTENEKKKIEELERLAEEYPGFHVKCQRVAEELNYNFQTREQNAKRRQSILRNKINKEMPLFPEDYRKKLLQDMIDADPDYYNATRYEDYRKERFQEEIRQDFLECKTIMNAGEIVYYSPEKIPV